MKGSTRIPKCSQCGGTTMRKSGVCPSCQDKIDERNREAEAKRQDEKASGTRTSGKVSQSDLVKAMAVMHGLAALTK